MPLFGQKRSNTNTDRKKYGPPSNAIPTESFPHIIDDTPTLLPPPPVSEANNATPVKPNPPLVIPSRKELLFHTQLAHGSSTKEVNDFSNVKELYQKITEIFGLGNNEVRIYIDLYIGSLS